MDPPTRRLNRRPRTGGIHAGRSWPRSHEGCSTCARSRYVNQPSEPRFATSTFEPHPAVASRSSDDATGSARRRGRGHLADRVDGRPLPSPAGRPGPDRLATTRPRPCGAGRTAAAPGPAWALHPDAAPRWRSKSAAGRHTTGSGPRGAAPAHLVPVQRRPEGVTAPRPLPCNAVTPGGPRPGDRARQTSQYATRTPLASCLTCSSRLSNPRPVRTATRSSFTVEHLTLEDLVLAYLSRADPDPLPALETTR